MSSDGDRSHGDSMLLPRDTKQLINGEHVRAFGYSQDAKAEMVRMECGGRRGGEGPKFLRGYPLCDMECDSPRE